MTQTYDAIIIGAGGMGISIAFHLAERVSPRPPQPTITTLIMRLHKITI
jgi:glycine/D-amino acid oxidase-like deaminating enzyme